VDLKRVVAEDYGRLGEGFWAEPSEVREELDTRYRRPVARWIIARKPGG
jgi:hypothetical protein